MLGVIELIDSDMAQQTDGLDPGADREDRGEQRDRASASSEPNASSSTIAAAARPMRDAAGDRAALERLEPAAAELDLQRRSLQGGDGRSTNGVDVGLREAWSGSVKLTTA